MNTALNTLVPMLLPLVLTGLLGATAWVAVHLGTYLRAKGQSSKAFAALAVLNDLVMSTVQDIENNEKTELLSISAGSALTPTEGARLKRIAMDRLKADLGAHGIETLQRVVSAVLGTSNIESFLSGKIEQAVTKVSATETAGGGAIISATVGVKPASSAMLAPPSVTVASSPR